MPWSHAGFTLTVPIAVVIIVTFIHAGTEFRYFAELYIWVDHEKY